jgi:hypothetical protein
MGLPKPSSSSALRSLDPVDQLPEALARVPSRGGQSCEPQAGKSALRRRVAETRTFGCSRHRMWPANGYVIVLKNQQFSSICHPPILLDFAPVAVLT